METLSVWITMKAISKQRRFPLQFAVMEVPTYFLMLIIEAYSPPHNPCQQFCLVLPPMPYIQIISPVASSPILFAPQTLLWLPAATSPFLAPMVVICTLWRTISFSTAPIICPCRCVDTHAVGIFVLLEMLRKVKEMCRSQHLSWNSHPS